MAVRVALGTAIHLGLRRGKSPRPTTAHLLSPGKCSFDCAYCTKARSATSRSDFMCRVTWPAYPEERIWDALAERAASFERICIQVVNSPRASAMTVKWLREINDRCDAPVSVETRVRRTSDVEELLRAGAECVGLPLDVASESLYPTLREGRLDKALELVLRSARRQPGRISTHIIVGLGETDREIVDISRSVHEWGVPIGLFAFTPCRGTKLASGRPPSLERFRRIQLATHLVNLDNGFDIEYDSRGSVVLPPLDDRSLADLVGQALLTKGCEGCNRPLYNERPSCTPYNYARGLTQPEIDEAMLVMRS